MAGFSPKTRQIIYERSGGLCEICYQSAFGGSVHHRQPRGMGGTASVKKNQPSNGLMTCGSGVSGCHGYLESHRAEAYAKGWLVRQHDDPSSIPFQDVLGQWYYLGEDGSKNLVG